MQEKTKNVLLVVLVVGLVSMTVAYAALSTTLTINSTAKIAASKWDIRFANISSASISNTQAGVTGTAEQVAAPQLSDNDTTISTFSVKFKQPGDKISYTFDIQNQGDLNAKLTSFTKGDVKIGGNITTDVLYDIVCGPANSQVAPVPEASMFNLDGKASNEATPASVSCTLSLTYKDTVQSMPADETTVTIDPTTFVFGQR